MPASQGLLIIFSVVTGLLVIASSIGFVLHVGKPAHITPETLHNLNTRIKAWWLIVGVLGAAFGLGNKAIVLLFFFVSLQAMREIFSHCDFPASDHHALIWCFYIALPLQYFLVFYQHNFFLFTFIPIFAFLFLPLLLLKKINNHDFLNRLTKMQWSIITCIYCTSYIPALISLKTSNNTSAENYLLIAFLIFTVQSCDVFQYIFGKLFGKHKIASKISPSKTWEGLAYGISASTILSSSLYWLTPFNFWHTFIMALTINIFGFYGGLVFSAVKRDLKIKDWGSMIKGHGGVLDRVDSLIFSAPVFFWIIYYGDALHLFR